MKYILIFLLGLITFQVNAQTKIIGSTTTASGDMQGTYPTIYVKPNVINRDNLTPTLRDSLTRFRKDTLIKKSTDGTLNLASLGNTLGQYNRVYILILGETGFTQAVIMPAGADTLTNTEFNVTYVSQDTTASCQVVAFDGFGYRYLPPIFDNSETTILELLPSGHTVRLNTVEVGGQWTWLSAVSKNIYGAFFDDATGITALTTDVVASGTGSVAATIQPNAVTSAKILDGTVSLADHASNSVNSSKLVDGSVALADMAANSVDNTKIVDYSITGTDLNYLTLRAGDATNAIQTWSAGAVKTVPVSGAWDWDANKLNFTIGGVRKRIPVFTEATPTGGQLMVGNGTDFTLANLTAGYAQTVTNGSGSITVNPDTTKVIPFIPNAEISNGTRSGYFWNRTSGVFGSQFYRAGYRIFNNSFATGSTAATGVSVSDLATTNIASIQASMSVNSPYIQMQVTGPDRGNKGYLFNENGASLPVVINSVSSNSQAVATYQIDGETSIEYITNSTPTNVTLPEISATPTAANSVGVGFTMWVCVNSSVGKNINASGADEIIRHGSTSIVTTFPTTGGTYYLKKFVALGLNTWGEF